MIDGDLREASWPGLNGCAHLPRPRTCRSFFGKAIEQVRQVHLPDEFGTFLLGTMDDLAVQLELAFAVTDPLC